jgi:hypothetical protein
MSSFLSDFLETGVYRLPLFAVCLVGLIWTINTWSRHGEVSLRVCLGLGFFLLGVVGGWLWEVYWISQFGTVGWASERLVDAAIGWLFSCLEALGLALVVWAALSNRWSGVAGRPRSRNPWDPDPPFRPGSSPPAQSDPTAVRDEGRY